MKKIIPFVLISFLFVSCQYSADNLFYSGNSVLNRAKNIKILEDNPVQTDKFSFFVISDVHIGSIKKNPPAEPYEQFFTWLNKFSDEDRPKICLCLGDVADTSSTEQYEEYQKIVSQIESYGIKVYNSVGNHDVYQSGWDNWCKYTYPGTSFYKFETQTLSFYSLDTGTGNIGTKQMESLKKQICSDSKPKIIFTHYPLYTNTFFFTMEDTTERNMLIDLFAKNDVKLYFCGHIHGDTEVFDFGKFKSHLAPSFRYDSKFLFVEVDGMNFSVSEISL